MSDDNNPPRRRHGPIWLSSRAALYLVPHAPSNRGRRQVFISARLPRKASP